MHVVLRAAAERKVRVPLRYPLRATRFSSQFSVVSNNESPMGKEKPRTYETGLIR